MLLVITMLIRIFVLLPSEQPFRLSCRPYFIAPGIFFSLMFYVFLFLSVSVPSMKVENL